MSVAVMEEPRVLHTIPGRIRIHLPEWVGQAKRSIETQIRQVPGVRRVQANALTGNILVCFQPSVTNEQTIVEMVGKLELDKLTAIPEERPAPSIYREKRGQVIRTRIAVRGMDRDPQLAQQVVERLESRPGVRAQANPLTGRVLVEFAEYEAELEDIVADIEGLELSELSGELRPAYPLDPRPLLQSITRVIGATLGLGLLATRRLLGVTTPLPGADSAIRIASILGIIHGIPPVRSGLRSFLGTTTADLLFSIPSIITLTLAGSPLGLAVIGSEALSLLSEVLALRGAWRRHEERVENAASAQLGAIVRLESGERPPFAAHVIEGTGFAIGRDGLPFSVVKGGIIPPGSPLYGGPFILKLDSGSSFQAFTPEPRPVPPLPTLNDRYQQAAGLLSLGYAGVTALLTRSFERTLISLLLINSRTSVVGQECADLAAFARVIRAGVTVVGTRKDRTIRLPRFLLFDGGRSLADKFEVVSVLSLTQKYNADEIMAVAAGIASAAGSPWKGGFIVPSPVIATAGALDGKVAMAYINDVQYTLGPDEDRTPEAASLRQQGNYILVLRSERERRPLAIVALRPRLVAGVAELVQICRRYGVKPVMLSSGDAWAERSIALRAHIPLIRGDKPLDVIRSWQEEKVRVAFVSDNVGAAEGFAACDLAIGLTDDRSHFTARVDLLAPDLSAIATIIETGARRDAAVRDSVGISALSNIAGIIWSSRAVPALEVASRSVYISILCALADSWWRLRGGKRSALATSHLVDPRPERWGNRNIQDILRTLVTSQDGLTTTQATQRQQQERPVARRSRLLTALLEQVRSPLITILAIGAGLSLALGATGDVIIISGTILVSIAVSLWQEHKASQVTEALKRMGATRIQVLRDGRPVTVSISDIVVGDIMLIASGDHIPADARVLSARNLTVDESTLTGEPLPVEKDPDGPTDSSRIVLRGSDVVSGMGSAIVVAVGRQTRMGTMAAVLTTEKAEANPLGVQLSRMLRLVLPVSVAGGALVVIFGFLWKRPLASILATGATIALAGVPEGLPLLAKVGEAGVAHRLVDRRAAVRHLAAIEALGRVDVACADKTGTMTQGHLTLTLVADMQQEGRLPDGPLRYILLKAALACPHPGAPDVKAHPTDMAVIQSALKMDMKEELNVKHDAELSFDPVRGFYATLVHGNLYIKGATESLVPRCRWILEQGERKPLDEQRQQDLFARSQHLAERGLRVLMVVEGSDGTSMEDPYELTALGFVGISDPLRPTVPNAVQRCHRAGVRVIMITGDHPSTARTIAREAGLLDHSGEIMLASELVELPNDEVDKRLAQAAVIARATPLDKLRIIESLQRQGHIVAMTGDGVNDAPALRLANVGVAMGSGGTEVARQTADVVLADDDFSTLVEALVEGRSFWRNLRRALGLLLGGNLGELGLVVSASLLGLDTPLTIRQILAVNAITDILPALAVALQRPEHRHLSRLGRERGGVLNIALRNDVFCRGIATAVPSFISFIIMLRSSMLAEARSIAFVSVVSTQLALTLDAGWAEGTLTRSVISAVGACVGILLITFTIPPLRTFLNLAVLPPFGWLLVGIGALTAVGLNRLLARLSSTTQVQPKATLHPMLATA